MNAKIISITIAIFFTTWFALGQGLIYDQQSTNLIEGAGFLKSDQPMGQSFTPSLSSIRFISLLLYDSDGLHSSGATVFVNLRSNSITGAIMSSTTPIFLPNLFSGVTNFLFTAAVPIVPGITYYFQPVIQSGDTIGALQSDGSYSGGTFIYQGAPYPGRNLWFQEGVIGVPEPTAIALLLAGGAWFCSIRRKW